MVLQTSNSYLGDIAAAVKTRTPLTPDQENELLHEIHFSRDDEMEMILAEESARVAHLDQLRQF